MTHAKLPKPTLGTTDNPITEILDHLCHAENEHDETTLTLLIELAESMPDPKHPIISLGEIAQCVAAGRQWWIDDNRLDYITDGAHDVLRGAQGYLYLGAHPVRLRCYQIGAAWADVMGWPERTPCRKCGK